MDFKNVVMNLEEGEIHQISVIDPSQRYRKVRFDKHRITLSSEGFGFQQSGEGSFRGDRELSADSMNSIRDSLLVQNENIFSGFISTLNKNINSLKAINYRDTVIQKIPDVTNSVPLVNSPEANEIVNLYTNVMSKPAQFKGVELSQQMIQSQIYRYEVEIYKKYSIPFACVVFVLIGAPLGYRVRKGGFGVAAGLSLLLFLVYWASLIGGEKLADRGMMSPLVGMWLANIALSIFGLYLMFKSS